MLMVINNRRRALLHFPRRAYCIRDCVRGITRGINANSFIFRATVELFMFLHVYVSPVEYLRRKIVKRIRKCVFVCVCAVVENSQSD